ncbi:unnamed protein product [Prunus brigantina]
MTAVDLINLSASAPLNGEVPNKFWWRNDNIEDLQIGDKPDNLREYPAKLDPISHPLECNDERDESNDTFDPTNDPIINEPVDDDIIDGHIADGVMDDVTDKGQEAQAHKKLSNSN